MRLSIIIPAYNAESHIERCLNSCLRQQKIASQDYEVIVIDDGSTDRTAMIVDEFMQEFSNVNLISKENKGVSSARNLGIEQSTGEYLLFVDADDELMLNNCIDFEKSLTEMEFDILVMHSVKQSTRGYDYIYPFKTDFEDIQFSGFSLYDNGFLRGSVCGVAFKKKFLSENDIIFHESIKNGEDSFFMTLCFIHSENIRFKDIVFYKVNETLGSASRSWNLDKIIEFINSLKTIKAYTDSNKLAPHQLEMINIKAYGVISNAVHHLIRAKLIYKVFVIRKLIKESGFLPLKTERFKLFRWKIFVLNTSVMLFIFLQFINQRLR